MEWNEFTSEYHSRTFAQECRLSSLPAEWQRELAAIWRLEADVNNGGYLQFLLNWGKESYVYASHALKKIGARKMAAIVDQCQALVDEHFDFDGASANDRNRLVPNVKIHLDGTRTVRQESILSNDVVVRILELSREFMDYPDDLSTLGWSYYRRQIEGDASGSADRD